MPAKMADELTGFSNPDESTEPTNDVKKKNKNKSSGGFQSMGFSFPILRGITKRGYKLPTPIQRKSIPIALEGRDVVAMARTGSGKTACFILPILEKLSGLNSKIINGKNLRALILSPTRELALQTLRFVRDLGKYTGLKSAAILGGDSIDQQFSVLTGTTPDIIVATPGRFLHICVEMNLQLSHIQMIVFDEADRLFELGFGEQLQEIVARLPSSRQSLLYSATLPKMLVEFARAGLSDPLLLRLDVEWKLPSTLWLGWISIRSELRAAALLQLLDIVLTPETPQAVVFVATKHHVDYLYLVLQHVGIMTACVYSGLDPSARKISLGRFTAKKCQVLLVTDVAARGLDLPALDTVINYHFPAKPKLFVHRVGRSARAGRSGRAFSFVSAEDTAHLVDLQLFLGTDLKYPDGCKLFGKVCESGIFGTLPPSLLELRHADVMQCEKISSEISEGVRVASNAWQQYGRCREPASAASNKRAKEMHPPALVHPFFAERNDDSRVSADVLISQIKQYRPKGTILEITAKNDSPMYLAMKAKKQKHGSQVNKRRQQDESPEVPAKKFKLSGNESSDKADADAIAILDRRLGDGKKPQSGKKQRKEIVRDENYIPHVPSDRHTEMGLAVNFNTEANAAQLELAPDSRDQLRQGRQQMKWDRRRKKMVHVDADGGKKMIKTESGGRIPASFKSGRYSEWQKRNNASHIDNDSDDDNRRNPGDQSNSISEFRPRWVKHNERVAKKKAMGRSSELRNTQQIVKERLRKDKIKARLKHKTKNKGKGKKRKK